MALLILGRPSYIIRHLFIDVPTTTVVKKLTAFFYGNDIPVSIVSQLYHACNDKCNSQVTKLMYNLYFHWLMCMYKFHMFEYYEVLKCKFVWINRKALNQLRK